MEHAVTRTGSKPCGGGTKASLIYPPPAALGGGAIVLMREPKDDTGIKRKKKRKRRKFSAPAWAKEPNSDHKYIRLEIYARRVASELRIEAIPLATKSCYILGKNTKTADIAIDHQSISRQHCALVNDGAGGIFACDIGSVHGTFVDGEKLTTNEFYQLSKDMTIKLGKCAKVKKTNFSNSKPLQPCISTCFNCANDERANGGCENNDL